MAIRTSFFAALAVSAALVVGAPAAGARTFHGRSDPTRLDGTAAGGVSLAGEIVTGPCGLTTAGQGQGGTGNIDNQVCQGGAGVSYIGTDIGQIATIIGPTIPDQAFVGSSVRARRIDHGSA
jgi:hypothetical protein